MTTGYEEYWAGVAKSLQETSEMTPLQRASHELEIRNKEYEAEMGQLSKAGPDPFGQSKWKSLMRRMRRR